MRAEQLTRKTHLKRHTNLPALAAGRKLFDLTDAVATADAQAADGYDLTAPPRLHTLADFAINAPGERAGDAEALLASADDIATVQELFAWCADILAHSPTAGRLLEEAANNGWSIGLAELGSGGFYLDTHGRYILLDHFAMTPSLLGRSIYFRNALLTTFVRALRDIWHERRFGRLEFKYKPEHALMLERIRAADCDTVTIQAGWELRGAGFADVWRHLLGAEEGDMAVMFTRYLERDPGALFDGAALACTFRQWYADQVRTDACDHETLEILDSLLNAAESAQPFGEGDLRPETVEARSLLPDGIRYLAGIGRIILADPVFAGLSDPVNQAHFFQLMCDLETTVMGNVPFRDGELARKIFPDGK